MAIPERSTRNPNNSELTIPFDFASIDSDCLQEELRWRLRKAQSLGQAIAGLEHTRLQEHVVNDLGRVVESMMDELLAISEELRIRKNSVQAEEVTW